MKADGSIAALLLSSAVACAPAGGAVKTPKPHEGERERKEERVERPVQFTEPADEMRKLGVLIGTWDIKETWVEPRRYKRGSYEGYPGEGGYGTLTIQPGPGEFSLLCDYVEHNPMGRVSAHGMISWDPVRRAYVLDRAHSAFPGILHLTGRFEKGGLVFRGEDTWLGKRRSVRLVMQEITTEGWTEIFEASEDDAMKRAVTFQFRRKPSPVPPPS